jgi:hypothetical protein
MLRRDADVWLHTRQSQLFRRETAVLNRFVAYLALKADQNAHRHKLRAVWGYGIAGSPLASTIRLTDATSMQPSHRYLRFGPDLEAHLRPFEMHVTSYKARRRSADSGYRPATPLLMASARARFASFVAAQEAPPAAEQVTDAKGPTNPTGVPLSLANTPDGAIAWRSPVPSSAAKEFWTAHDQLVLACQMTPDEAGPLRFVVARLVAHAKSYRLSCQNPSAWTQFFRGFVDNKRPGPGVEVKFRVSSLAADANDGSPSELIERHELASRIHSSLDYCVLERLNGLALKCLHPATPMAIGWEIEPGLRRLMEERWRKWHEKLLASDAKRRRFLILLASADDELDLGPEGLVRVGPRCVEPFLLRPTLFALAFAVCANPGLSPSASFPGNLGVPRLSAHALGVAWLDGLDVGPDVGSRPWSTNVVLMSELREPPLRPPLLPRLDRDESTLSGMQNVPPHEQPLIVGCTHSARTAMRIGEAAAREYFTRLLRERAEAAARTLE